MPRIRTIKPEFYRHHDLFLAEKKSGFPIRVAFSGLWCCADKEGRFKWKPTELKLDILPYDELDFEKVLQCLIDFEFIKKYVVDGKQYGLIPTFKEHQRITGTEKNYESKLPEFNGNTMESHDVSIENTSNTQEKSQIIDNQTAFQDDSIETLRQVGKEYKKGEKRKEYKKGENFNTMPFAENFNGIPENKIGASIELVRITKSVDINKKNVQDLWEVFKVQNLTGTKYYSDEEAVYSHFINWIKIQNFKEIKKDSTTSVKKESEVDFNKYLKPKRVI